MARAWPLIAILAAAVAVGVFVFGGDSETVGSLPGNEDYLGEDESNPELLTSEAARSKRERDAEAARRKAAEEAARRAAPVRRLFLKGRVLGGATNRPLAGARLHAEPADDRCPRLSVPMRDALRGLPAPPGGDHVWSGLPPAVLTDAGGQFTWYLPEDARAGARVRADVWVSAPGHVTTMLCEPAAGSEVTVRMQPALALAVHVADRHGLPVEGARVLVRPGEGVDLVPGHAGLARTDAKGESRVDGLLAGDVMVTADHPEFMPVTVGPIDPAVRKQIDLTLPPAMRFSFTIRSDDGSEIKGPILQWTTDGRPPHGGLLLLPVTGSGPPATPLAEVQSTEAVRVPCDHRNVHLELKADGFEALKLPPETLPSEGGEKELIAVLVRDTSLCSLRVRFVDKDGEPVNYVELGPSLPSIMNLDGKDVGSLKLESSDTLFFPSLPAGNYRIGKTSPGYAPAEVEATLRAGEANEVTVALRPTAKLKVIFRAGRRIMVKFRLRRDGRVITAYPENADEGGEAAMGTAPLVAGDTGGVFSGLGAGTVTVEVVDPALIAESKSVRLTEGETTEVEIDVRER